MRRKAAAAGLAIALSAVLAGCSSEPSTPAAQPSAASSSAQEAGPPPGATGTGAALGAGSALTGQVSALNSDVSGLNIRVTDMGTIIDLPADALFDFDQATLTPGATEQLTKSAELIRKAPPGAIRIIGYTDSKGEDAYNQKLSEARAGAVADWFRQQVGVRQRDLQVSGQGEASPVAPNETADGRDDPAGRAKNRRVEVILPNKA